MSTEAKTLEPTNKVSTYENAYYHTPRPVVDPKIAELAKELGLKVPSGEVRKAEQPANTSNSSTQTSQNQKKSSGNQSPKPRPTAASSRRNSAEESFSEKVRRSYNEGKRIAHEEAEAARARMEARKNNDYSRINQATALQELKEDKRRIKISCIGFVIAFIIVTLLKSETTPGAALDVFLDMVLVISSFIIAVSIIAYLVNKSRIKKAYRNRRMRK